MIYQISSDSRNYVEKFLESILMREWNVEYWINVKY